MSLAEELPLLRAEYEKRAREQAQFWAHEAKMSRGRNYIALAAIVAAITASVTAALAKLL